MMSQHLGILVLVFQCPWVEQVKISTVWEGRGVWVFSKMGWGFRAVAVATALVEALVHFLGKNAGKVVVCLFLLQVGFSSVMGQGGLSSLSTSESSLRI
jgi:hypothetical protein